MAGEVEDSLGIRGSLRHYVWLQRGQDTILLVSGTDLSTQVDCYLYPATLSALPWRGLHNFACLVLCLGSNVSVAHTPSLASIQQRRML